MKMLSTTALLAALSVGFMAAPALAQQSIHSGMLTGSVAENETAPAGSQTLQAWNGQSIHNAMPIFADAPTMPLDNSGVVQVGSVHSGTVESLASLPEGFTDGSARQAYAQSVQRFYAGQDERGNRVAGR